VTNAITARRSSAIHQRASRRGFSTLGKPGKRLLHHFRFVDRAALQAVETVVEFARRNQVTQIFVAHSEGRLLERLGGKNFTENIVRLAQDLQVTVVADRSRMMRRV
jgi:K+-sensing histidine kinase KdpD